LLWGDLAATEQQMKWKVSIFISTLGRGKVRGKKSRNTTNGGMVAAGNMEGQTPTRTVWWSAHHGASAFGMLGQDKSIDGIMVGSDEDRKTAHLVRVFNSILAGAADNLESRKIVMCQRMMNRQGSHVVAVGKSFGAKEEQHVNQQSPCTSVTSNLVENELTTLEIRSLGKFGTLLRSEASATSGCSMSIAQSARWLTSRCS
jgi:hypothetical protein